MNTVAGELCRVIDFVPLGGVKNGKVWAYARAMPYAVLGIECKKLFVKRVQLFLVHRIDFTQLWQALEERGEKKDEEVCIVWSVKRRAILGRLFTPILPKLRMVAIYPKGCYEKFTDPNWLAQKSGEALFKEMQPIVMWEPPSDRFLH